MRRRAKSLLSWLSSALARSVLSALDPTQRPTQRPAQRRTVANPPRPVHSPPVSPSVSVSEPTSNALTRGIRVVVQSLYLPDQSSPEDDHYAFAYTVAIANEGEVPAQLRTRHWIITDGNGGVQDVKGDGVVGKQPRLLPGEAFEYTSGCVLPTPLGTMHGSYQMFLDDGTQFDAVIAPFTLASPLPGRNRTLN